MAAHPQPPAHAVRALKTSDRGTVWLVRPPGQPARTLKTWPLTPWLALKLLVGGAQPQRLAAGVRRLERAGIRVAPVAGRWRGAWRGGPKVEMELRWVEGRSALELLRDPALDDAARRRHSAAIGRVVGRLVEARLFNRDVKLENLIVDGAGEVWLIDTVDIRAMRDVTVLAARMLERLAVQPADLGIPLSPASWVPAMRAALRGLPIPARRAVVRSLKEHRRRRSS